MNVISLFAGCGGLDLGFERAGFNIVWANEYDKSISDTYRFNHPKTILNTNDIRSLQAKDIPDCDGIIGGPPCQAWSEGGKRLGIEDPRGQLFFDYIRIVKEKQPKFFLIENVQGILDDKHRVAFNGFLNLLQEAGYKITYELLNAADYKVPQDRYRIFLVGFRKDIKNTFTFPDAISTTPITLKQAIGDITETPRYYDLEYINSENEIRSNHDTYIGSYDSKYMSRNRVRSWDETSFTIQAQARNIPQHPQAPKMTFLSQDRREFTKGYEHLYRRLSIRECARIQTFPDHFRFIYSDVKNGYKMVGNAVPPRLAWRLALQIKKAFTTNNGQNNIPVSSIPESLLISDVITSYPKSIITNCNPFDINDKAKNVLIGLVKKDNEKNYLNHSAQSYYTGKEFPRKIAFEKLYYFMPYLKSKGIRDLYIIREVHIGTKQEIIDDCHDESSRLILKIQFVKQLFNDYLPIHLNIWHTFTETTLNELMKLADSTIIE